MLKDFNSQGLWLHTVFVFSHYDRTGDTLQKGRELNVPFLLAYIQTFI